MVKPESLADLCADAFVLSNEVSHQVCWQALKFEAASATATWQTRAGGTAVLNSRVIRIGKRALHPNRMSLKLYQHPAPNAFEVRKYLFSTAAPDDLEVFRTIIPVTEAIHDGHLDQRHLHAIETELKRSHAQIPTAEDILLLRDELARGASGRYSPDALALEQL